MRIGTKIILTLATLLCSLGTVGAQQREVALGVRGGYNVALGAYSAVSLEGNFGVADNVDVLGGVQWATYGRSAVELRPSYVHSTFVHSCTTPPKTPPTLLLRVLVRACRVGWCSALSATTTAPSVWVANI